MKIGTNDINKIMLGSAEVEKIYLGTEQVYGGEPNPYVSKYLTIESTSDNNTIYWWSINASTKTISASTDNGETWTEYTSTTGSGTTIATLNSGNTLIVKGTNTEYSSNGIFKSTSSFIVYGNAMSLIYGDNFAGQKTLPSGNAFYSLFYQCTGLTSAENLVLPATTLTSRCYREMFKNCSSLITPPALPATTIVLQCYLGMFEGCTSLTTAPELPATTLANADSCYQRMFVNCTSLTTPPELPATILTVQCYYQMFKGCSGLTTAPSLPATSLANGCYSEMLSETNVLPDCSNIDFTSTQVVSSGGLKGLFMGTKVTDADLNRILPKNANEKYCLPVRALTSYCYEYMFRDCTSLTTAPELPATTLANACYNYMFQGCSNLTTAPELPAITLADYCYRGMFFNCQSLNYIKCLATSISASQSTYNWVLNVAATGTFVKAASMSSWTTGVSGIPTGWTVQDDDGSPIGSGEVEYDDPS